tara:strand:- start:151 stop:720 length:570 start_codon:yes stop_codon:yes gene_type:complete
MAIMTPEEMKNVVPGSSMTKPKGMLPFERPAKTSDPEEGIQLVFDAITQPLAARRLVRTLRGGVPIDVVVDGLGTLLLGEGIISPQALTVMQPAVTSIVEGMASIAGVELKYTEEVDEWTEPDPLEVERLAAKIAKESPGLVAPVEEAPVEEAPVEEAPVEETMVEEPIMEKPAETMGLMSPPVKEGIM